LCWHACDIRATISFMYRLWPQLQPRIPIPIHSARILKTEKMFNGKRHSERQSLSTRRPDITHSEKKVHYKHYTKVPRINTLLKNHSTIVLFNISKKLRPEKVQKLLRCIYIKTSFSTAHLNI